MTNIENLRFVPSVKVPGAVVEQVVDDFVLIGLKRCRFFYKNERGIGQVLPVERVKTPAWENDHKRRRRILDVHTTGDAPEVHLKDVDILVGRSDPESSFTEHVVLESIPVIFVSGVIASTAATVERKYQQEKQPSHGCGG